MWQIDDNNDNENIDSEDDNNDSSIEDGDGSDNKRNDVNNITEWWELQ